MHRLAVANSKLLLWECQLFDSHDGYQAQFVGNFVLIRNGPAFTDLGQLGSSQNIWSTGITTQLSTFHVEILGADTGAVLYRWDMDRCAVRLKLTCCGYLSIPTKSGTELIDLRTGQHRLQKRSSLGSELCLQYGLIRVFEPSNTIDRFSGRCIFNIEDHLRQELLELQLTFGRRVSGRPRHHVNILYRKQPYGRLFHASIESKSPSGIKWK